jgi:hypothetical protein
MVVMVIANQQLPHVIRHALLPVRLQDRLVRLVRQVSLAHRDRRALPVRRDYKDQQAHRANKVPLEPA